MKLIPYQVFLDAGYHWDEYIGKKHEFASFSHGLDQFLGWEVLNSAQWGGKHHTEVMVAEHTVDKFHMLASPHFRTLLKAYEAKNGVTVCKSEQHAKQSS